MMHSSVLDQEAVMSVWFAFVMHDDIEAYRALGWREPDSLVCYPRLEQYGTTMEWRGEGEPPVPDKQ